MPKQLDEKLFRLIHSLSKSEKRSFKISANRLDGLNSSKKFILLFDAIHQQKVYNEEKILRSNPTISRVQLPNLKNHLYLQILKCLRTNLNAFSPEMLLSEMLDHAKILYHKCLYDDALKIIDKAKKQARIIDNSFLLLELIELEKLALLQGLKENIEERVHTIISDTTRTSESIQYINRFSNLSLQLNAFYQKIGFIRNEEDLKNIKKFFHKNLPSYKEDELTLQEKIYLHYAFTGYYFFIQDFQSGFNHAKEWVKLFDENPEMIPNKIELYIKGLNSLLVVQNKLYRYYDFMDTHRKLVGIKRNRKLVLTENINLSLFRTIYIHEINRHFMLGEFKSGIKIVGKLSNELNTFFPKLDKHSVLIFYYKIACLYFGAGQYKNSLKWLNFIINDTDTELREDLHSFSRILKLICYFELKDEEMVENNIRSTYRFLKKKRSFEKYQSLITEFLRKLQKNYSEKQVIDQFKKLKTKMVELEKDEFEKKAFIYFDIISYLESRISNKSIEDIIQEKARIKLLKSKAA